MTRLSKIYCLVSVVLACGFVANLLVELSGISTDPWMLILGLGYITWLPISLVGCVLFLVRGRPKLAICAASYAVYVIVNYLATPDVAGRVKLDVGTTCGLVFFGVYGICNAWLLKQLSSGNKQVANALDQSASTNPQA